MIYDKSLQDVYSDKQRDWTQCSIKPNEDMNPIEVMLYGIMSQKGDCDIDYGILTNFHCQFSLRLCGVYASVQCLEMQCRKGIVQGQPMKQLWNGDMEVYWEMDISGGTQWSHDGHLQYISMMTWKNYEMDCPYCLIFFFLLAFSCLVAKIQKGDSIHYA